MTFKEGHALIVGVGSFAQAPKYDVPITVSEAKAVSAVLTDKNYCGYTVEQVTLLTKTAATRANIINELQRLADSAGAEGTVFLYFVSHGVTGSDGYWHFMTHDSTLTAGQVEAGTGLSEVELTRLIQGLKAKRVIAFFNACFSGHLSPTLAANAHENGDGLDFAHTLAPPPNLKYALLGTGRGRIIMTAAGDGEYSYFQKGQGLTIFGDALVSGLKGSAVFNNKGFISAFSLYEALYTEVKDRVKSLFKGSQQPELSVLKGVGPFAVSLYRGASTLGDFEPEAELPRGVQPVPPEKAGRIVNNYLGDGATVTHTTINAGDIAGDLILGNRIEGNSQNVGGNIITIEGGGSYFAGPVTMGAGNAGAATPSPLDQLQTIMTSVRGLTIDADLREAVTDDLEAITTQLKKPKPNRKLIERKLSSAIETLREAGATEAAQRLINWRMSFG